MNEIVLTAQSLVKTYPNTTALAGVNFQLKAGEAVAVMGPSGSGKTTLLHGLAGIIALDSGMVILATAGGPRTITALNDAQRSALRREALGFVFQQGLLLPELTAVENVALPLMLNGVPRARAQNYASQWMAALGLSGMENRRLGQMSGGQAQHVAIARAQVNSPAVVFADEPTGALDSATSTEVMAALVHATAGRGRSLVVVTHDERVAAWCSRIVRLADGRIVSEELNASGYRGIRSFGGEGA